jgi:glutamate/tyrosine decarboxylase-like PLP-dependent enzyme
VDVDPETWQIDPAKIEAKITRNTVAILPVHIVGGICDMDRINAIARKHNLIMTGGSDCHQNPIIMGTLDIPAWVAEQFSRNTVRKSNKSEGVSV